MKTKNGSKIYIYNQNNIEPEKSVAFDEYLINKARKENVSILKFFNIKNGTISIGARQSKKDFDILKCNKDGIKIVRRITAGVGTWVSDGELCYTFILNKNDLIDDEKGLEVYNYLRDKFKTIYDFYNIETERYLHETLFMDSVCFSMVGYYDILIKNKFKNHVSASRNYNDIYIENGQLLINDNFKNIYKYSKKNNNENISKSLNEILNKEIKNDDIKEKVINIFTSMFSEVKNKNITKKDKEYILERKNIFLEN